MKKGFTLVEILVAVMIVTLLVVMAVPMYEKTVEKSRMAEVRILLKEIYEAKIRTLDSMDRENFSYDLFGFEALDVSLGCINPSTGARLTRCTGPEAYTKDFKYVLYSPASGVPNAVCAVRRKGDNVGVAFLYVGDQDATDGEKFFCNDGPGGGSCDAYGLDSIGTAWCTL